MSRRTKPVSVVIAEHRYLGDIAVHGPYEPARAALEAMRLRRRVEAEEWSITVHELYRGPIKVSEYWPPAGEGS